MVGQAGRGWLGTGGVLLAAALLARPGLLTGVYSAEDHLSVHHAFQSEPGGRVHNPAMSDPAVQFKALRVRAVEALREGRAPLWNPDVYAGAPLLGDAQSAPLSVATLLRVPRWMPDGVAANLAVLWTLLWVGLGTAGLGRALGLGVGAAAVAGVAALTGPFVQVWLLHPHAASFVWWPWLLWWVEALRRGASPLWGALAALGLVAGGHPETAAQGGLVVVAWAALRLRGGAAWAGLGGGLGLGVLLSAPLWAPVLEQVLGSATAQAHGGNRILPAQLLDLLWPNLRGHPATEAGVAPGGVWADGVLHPGLGALGLAAAALRGRAGRALALAWLLCVGLALSGWGAPMNNSRLGGAGAWFLALAAGFGAAGLGPRGLWLAGLGVALCGAWARRLDHTAVPWAAHDPVPAAWTQALRAQVGEGRVVGLGWALQPNTGALVGLRDLRGYDLPVAPSTERLMRALDPRVARPWFPVERLTPRAARVMRFAGVRVVLAPGDLAPDPALATLPELELGAATVRAFWLDPTAPRAWLAWGASPTSDPDQALEEVAAGRRDRRAPQVEGLGAPLAGLGEPLALPVVSRGGAHLTLPLPPREAPALAVLTERWDPGWRAALDGQPAPVRRVAGVFLGVELPPGAQELVFVYDPLGWRLGRALGALGVLGGVGVLGVGLVRRRRSAL